MPDRKVVNPMNNPEIPPPLTDRPPPAADEPAPDDEEGSPDDDQAGLPIEEADVQAYCDEESQRRLWLRTIIPLLQLRSHDSDPSGRVQLAFDLLHIAACERAARILRGDLAGERG
jgi:hypothetical protein